jgi:hypothetical protein
MNITGKMGQVLLTTVLAALLAFTATLKAQTATGQITDESRGAVAHSKIPTAGLVAYYPFNGNANDASGNGFDCTPIGAVLTSDQQKSRLTMPVEATCLR